MTTRWQFIMDVMHKFSTPKRAFLTCILGALFFFAPLWNFFLLRPCSGTEDNKKGKEYKKVVSVIPLKIQDDLQRSNSNDFISQTPDDILVMILSLMPIKDAVVTSSLSTRWKFLWSNLTQLNFDDSETCDKEFYMNQEVFYADGSKFMNQVTSVIKSYNHPIVRDFRIHSNQCCHEGKTINEWLHFAVNKKVEFLELNFKGKIQIYSRMYDFPKRLFETKLFVRELPSEATFVLIPSLKKLILKNVKVTEKILEELLSNSRRLDTIVIHEPKYLKHICIAGRALRLKHFEIVADSCLESIYLSDFDLESFTYKGRSIDLRLSHLPKLEDVKFHLSYSSRLDYNYNVFGHLSSCALSLKALSIAIHCPQENMKLVGIPELPNVKKLKVAMGEHKCDTLIYLASILNACPNLVSLTIKPRWRTLNINRMQAKDVTKPNIHLKLVRIVSFRGLSCDLELAEYMLETSAALNKLVFDTRPALAIVECNYERKFTKSSAKSHLLSIVPQDVQLVVI